VLALEHGVERQSERELDRLAGRAGRGNDDDPPGGRLGGEKRLRIGWEGVVAG